MRAAVLGGPRRLSQRGVPAAREGRALGPRARAVGISRPLPRRGGRADGAADSPQRAAEGRPAPPPASLALRRTQVIKSDLFYYLAFVVSASLNSRTSRICLCFPIL